MLTSSNIIHCHKNYKFYCTVSPKYFIWLYRAFIKIEK